MIRGRIFAVRTLHPCGFFKSSRAMRQRCDLATPPRTLEREQLIQAPLEVVFDVFKQPTNLQRIRSDFLSFRSKRFVASPARVRGNTRWHADLRHRHLPGWLATTRWACPLGVCSINLEPHLRLSANANRSGLRPIFGRIATIVGLLKWKPTEAASMIAARAR